MATSKKSETSERKRCRWVEGGNELYFAYHDEEWGVPLHDDHKLFEFLVLEGAQAGLSWATVLNKREAYRRAFHDFDVAKVARMTDAALEKRLLDPGIIRNRQKIWSARNNARAALKVIEEVGNLDKYFWSFVGGKPIRNQLRGHGDVPARTDISDKLSKDLQKRGFNFVGSTIMYAHMQATGMVNDHLVTCFRHDEV